MGAVAPGGGGEGGRRLAAGALAGGLTRTLLAPLERVKLEMQLNRATGAPLGVARSIVRAESMLGLWRGNLVNLFRTVPFRCVPFISLSLPPPSPARRHVPQFIVQHGREGPSPARVSSSPPLDFWIPDTKRALAGP